MLNTLMPVLFMALAVAIVVVPSRETELLMPEPRRRDKLRAEATLDEAETLSWIARVQAEGSRQPWDSVPPPRRQAQTMVPSPFLSAPPAATSQDSPPADWWVQSGDERPARPRAEARAWQAGDSGDPPTLVRGLFGHLEEDLGAYLEEMPRYGRD